MTETIDDEEALIAQAKTDPEAFGQIYELYVDKIYSYIYYRVGNPQEAEDLTAKVFYRAMNHIPHYQSRGAPFAAWLYRIAKNLVANWHRDTKRRQTIDIDSVTLFEQTKSPQQAAERRDAQELLLDAIGKLPSERQQLLTLKFIEKMSNAEIGTIMGRSEGAIKSLYHRTLLSLKKILAEHENLVNEAITDQLDSD